MKASCSFLTLSPAPLLSTGKQPCEPPCVHVRVCACQCHHSSSPTTTTGTMGWVGSYSHCNQLDHCTVVSHGQTGGIVARLGHMGHVGPQAGHARWGGVRMHPLVRLLGVSMWRSLFAVEGCPTRALLGSLPQGGKQAHGATDACPTEGYVATAGKCVPWT